VAAIGVLTPDCFLNRPENSGLSLDGFIFNEPKPRRPAHSHLIAKPATDPPGRSIQAMKRSPGVLGRNDGTPDARFT
jgi:hypothetical protein